LARLYTVFCGIIGKDGMRYVLAINGEPVKWPYSERKWRADNPNISMRRWAGCSDEALASVNVYRVEEAPRPEINEREQVADRLAAPSLVDGVWVWGWAISAKSQADIDTYDADGRVKIKKEAQRRIDGQYPLWRQMNTMARMLEMTEKPVPNRTGGDLAQINAARAMFAEINAIRAKSNALEAMTPIPADYADDRWWT